MYRLLCFDLDGTLLRSDKTIDPKTIDILRKLNGSGIELLIATGRHLDFAKQLTSGLGCPTIIAANNGALLYDVNVGMRIAFDYLEQQTVKSIYRMAGINNMHALVYVDYSEEGIDMMVNSSVDTTNFDKNVVRDLTRIRIIDSEDQVDKVLSLVFSGAEDKLLSLGKLLDDNYKNTISFHIMSAMYSGHGILEVMNRNVSKWNAIERYASERGIDNSQIIAFGDEVNDTEMLEKSGLGIAMANASRAVKESADIVTKYSNDESGISRQLEELFKET